MQFFGSRSSVPPSGPYRSPELSSMPQAGGYGQLHEDNNLWNRPGSSGGTGWLPPAENVTLEPEYVERVVEVPKYKEEWVERLVEVPEPMVVDRVVEVPQIQEVIKETPGPVEVELFTREVPRVHVRQVERVVEVPQVTYKDRFIEVPVVHEVVRRIPRIQVHEIPIERVIQVPKKVVQEIEQPVYRPVPHLVNCEVEQEIPVPRVQLQTMETVNVRGHNEEYHPPEIHVVKEVQKEIQVVEKPVIQPVIQEVIVEKIIERPIEMQTVDYARPVAPMVSGFDWGAPDRYSQRQTAMPSTMPARFPEVPMASVRKNSVPSSQLPTATMGVPMATAAVSSQFPTATMEVPMASVSVGTRPPVASAQVPVASARINMVPSQLPMATASTRPTTTAMSASATQGNGLPMASVMVPAALPPMASANFLQGSMTPPTPPAAGYPLGFGTGGFATPPLPPRGF